MDDNTDQMVQDPQSSNNSETDNDFSKYDYLRNITIEIGDDWMLCEGNMFPKQKLALKIYKIMQRMYVQSTAAVLAHYCQAETDVERNKCLRYFPKLAEYFKLCEKLSKRLKECGDRIQQQQQNAEAEAVNPDKNPQAEEEKRLINFVTHYVAKLVPDDKKFISYGALPGLSFEIAEKLIEKAEKSRIGGSSEENKPVKRHAVESEDYVSKKSKTTEIDTQTPDGDKPVKRHAAESEDRISKKSKTTEIDTQTPDGDTPVNRHARESYRLFLTKKIKIDSPTPGITRYALKVPGGTVGDVKADNEYPVDDENYLKAVCGDPGYFVDPYYQGQKLSEKMLKAINTLLYEYGLPNALANSPDMLADLPKTSLDTNIPNTPALPQTPQPVLPAIDDAAIQELAEQKLAEIDINKLEEQYSHPDESNEQDLEADEPSDFIMEEQASAALADVTTQEQNAPYSTPATREQAKNIPYEYTVHPLNIASQYILRKFGADITHCQIYPLQNSERYLGL